jgi:TIR domain-containing protein
MLEAEGWTTWWDTSLTIGDDFRNEIMTELGRARAVIVIWTDTSIKSDWVRSEAGRAQGRLIPVKLPHLEYEDLPPPFDVLHTENVGEENKIRAASLHSWPSQRWSRLPGRCWGRGSGTR